MPTHRHDGRYVSKLVLPSRKKRKPRGFGRLGTQYEHAGVPHGASSKDAEIGVQPLPSAEAELAPPPQDDANGAKPRLVALTALHRVERDGAWLNRLWSSLFRSFAPLTAHDRALAGEIALGVMRHRARLDHTLAQLADRPLDKLDPRVLAALRAGLYQLTMLSRIPDHAAVSATVAALEQATNSALAGYANAVLRAYLRRREELERPDDIRDASRRRQVLYSVPWWLDEVIDERITQNYPAFRMYGVGDDMEARRRRLFEWMNGRAGVCLRVNVLRTSREALAASLTAAGCVVRAGHFAPTALHVDRAGDPTALPGFAQGHFSVQDEAAQVVGMLVDPKPGMRVLEIGAAPGGKTTHLAELMGDEGEVVGMEKHGEKVGLIREGAARLGLACIRAVVGDAEKPGMAAPAASFDRVLLDAPCSGLGVLRRHPEAKWTKTPEHIAALAKRQAKLLHHASQYVAPGGELVYAVCTFTADEGEKQAKRFLASHTNFVAVHPADEGPAEPRQALFDGRALRTTGIDDLDGFYAIRMRRIDTPTVSPRALGKRPPRKPPTAPSTE